MEYWSARDAPVPPPADWGRHDAECKQADEGVGRGPGGPPHDLCRIATGIQTKWHWAILPAAAVQAAFSKHARVCDARKRRLKAGCSQDWLPHGQLDYGLATLQLPACTLPEAPAGEPADQNSDTMPQGSPNRALLFATTLIMSFCKPAQLR